MKAVDKKCLSSILLVISIFIVGNQSNAEHLVLFTEQEEAKLNIPFGKWQQYVFEYSTTHSHGDVLPYSKNALGPIVSIVDPSATGEQYRASIPVKLLVYLKSFQSPIDLESLAITGKRGIFSLDITDRLLPFMRQPKSKENADYVIEGEIPHLRSGNYHVVFSLADIQGNTAEHSLFLEVTQPVIQ